VEPTRSQNITVNCRRSASGDAGRDLAVVGDAAGRLAFLALLVPWRLQLLAGAGLLSVFRAVPHSGQNFAAGRACWPQLGQRGTNEIPHSSQNLALSGFSKPQLAQRMLLLYSFGRSGARKRLSPRSQAAIFCCVRVGRCTPSTYGAPTYMASTNSAPLSLRKVDPATCNIFQINAVAFSTFLKRLAAVVVWAWGGRPPWQPD